MGAAGHRRTRPCDRRSRPLLIIHQLTVAATVMAGLRRSFRRPGLPGGRVVSSSHDGTLRVLDLASGETTRVYGSSTASEETRLARWDCDVRRLDLPVHPHDVSEKTRSFRWDCDDVTLDVGRQRQESEE